MPDTGQVSVIRNGASTSEPLDPSGINVIDHGFADEGTYSVIACFGGSTVYQDTCTTVGVEQDVVAIRHDDDIDASIRCRYTSTKGS